MSPVYLLFFGFVGGVVLIAGLTILTDLAADVWARRQTDRVPAFDDEIEAEESAAMTAFHDAAAALREAAEDEANEAHYRAAVELGNSHNVYPLRESEAAQRIAAILAHNEAARADWSEPGRWSE